MKRIKVPAKTVQNFSDVFDNLQDAVAHNLLRRQDRLYKNYGLIFDEKNGSANSLNWKVELVQPHTHTKFRVKVGESQGTALGLIPSGEIIGISTDQTVNPSSIVKNKYYLVYVMWSEYGTEPIATADGFLYDASGTTNTQNTSFLDRTTISISEYASLESAVAAADSYVANASDDNKIPLAVLKTLSDENVTWDDTVVIDLRYKAQLLLNDYLLDDSQVLLKDRNSTASDGGAIDANIDITGTLEVDSNVTLNANLSLEESTSPTVTLTESAGSETLAISRGSANSEILSSDNLNIKSTNDSVSIETGTEGKKVVVDDGNVSINVTETQAVPLYVSGDAEITEDLTVSDEFYVDHDNSKIVIGSTTVDATNKILIDGATKLSSTLNINDNFYFTNTNKLGLGTDTPLSALHISGGNLQLSDDYKIQWDSLGYTSIAADTTGSGKFIFKIGNNEIAEWAPDEFAIDSHIKLNYDTTKIKDKDGNILLKFQDNAAAGKTEVVISDSDDEDIHVNIESDSVGINTTADNMGTSNFVVTGESHQDDVVYSASSKLEWEATSDNKPSITHRGSGANGRLYLGLNADYSTDLLSGPLLDSKRALAIELANPTESGTGVSVYVSDPEATNFNQSRDKRLEIKNTDTTIFNDLYLGQRLGQYVLRTKTSNDSGNKSKLGDLEVDHLITLNGNTTHGDLTIYGNLSSSVISANTHLNLPGENSYVTSSGYLAFNYPTGSAPSGILNIGIPGLKDSIILHQVEPDYDTNISFKDYSGNTDWVLTRTKESEDSFKILHKKAGEGELTNALTITVDENNLHVLTVDSINTNKLNYTELDIVAGSGIVFNDVYANSIISNDGSFNLGVNRSSFNGIYVNDGTLSVANDSNVVKIGSAASNSNLEVTGQVQTNSLYSYSSSNTIPGVSNTQFLIGVGILGDDGAGIPAMLDPGAGTAPDESVRIYDMIPVAPSDDVPFGNTRDFYTQIIWGWTGLTSSVVSVPDRTVSILQEEIETLENADDLTVSGNLVGRYYKVGANSTLITDTEISGNNVVLTLDTDWNESAETCSIIEDADEFELEIKEWGPTVNDPANNNTYSTTLRKLSIDDLITTIDCKPYHKYHVRTRTRKGLNYTAWNNMSSGSYDPDHAAGGQASVPYNEYWVAELPYLANDNASISAEATNFGFEVLAGNSWKNDGDPEQNCHGYHFTYTTTTSGFNFNDTGSSYNHVYQTSSYFNVATSASQTYQVGVRPVQNGMVVGDGLTSSVVSGAGGMPPQGELLAQKDFNLLYAAGTVDTNDGNTISITDGREPDIDEFYSNQIINCDSKNYRITTDTISNSDRVLEVENLTDPDDTTLTVSAAFTIAGNSTSRRILKTQLSKDVKLTRMVLDVETIYNDTGLNLSENPVVVRVYQEGNSGAADSITVSSSNSYTSQEIDVYVRSSIESTRTLIIDAYDPSGDNNETNIKAAIQIYGMAEVAGGAHDIPMS